MFPAILVTLVVVDAFVFFAIGVRPPGYAPRRFFEISEDLGWFHRPGAQGWWYRYHDGSKYWVRTNSHGFADSERDIAKTRPRIALIGDSTTEFWEAEEKERGQYVIEAALDGRYEVLNFGVRGYGTDQTYLLFNKTVADFEPDIVIYTFCINDLWDNTSTIGKPWFEINPTAADGLTVAGYPIQSGHLSTIGVSPGFHTYSIVYRTLRLGLYRFKGLLDSDRPSTSLDFHFELRPFKRVYDEDDEKRMEITTRLISLLHERATERGMHFLLVEGMYKRVLDPGQRDMLVSTYGPVFDFDRVSRALARHAEANGIAFLSLPAQLRSQEVDVRTLMHRDDNMHLDATGIRFYAGAVVEELGNRGWIEESIRSVQPSGN